MKITLSKDLNKEAIKDAYEDALISLTQIQTTNLDTNAKLQTAIKKEAEILEKLLKFIKGRLIN